MSQRSDDSTPPAVSRGGPGLDRRHFLALAAAGGAGLLLPRPAHASLQLSTHDPEAGRLLSRALAGTGFWQGAQVKAYDDELYDEVRLQELDKGYLAQVSGEGGRDFEHETVVATVFDNMGRLPTVEDGAKAVVELGRGTDARTGLPYRDAFYFLDFTLFYGTYMQRMYKKVDGDRTVLYFEKLRPAVAGAQTYDRYKARTDEISAGVKRRALFNGIQEVTQIFGMFVVSPGDRFKTRVTFTTKVFFGEGSGMIARMGSDMPPVIKAGLRSGFESSVAIAGQLEPA